MLCVRVTPSDGQQQQEEQHSQGGAEAASGHAVVGGDSTALAAALLPAAAPISDPLAEILMALAAVSTSRSGSALAEAALSAMPATGFRGILADTLLAPLPATAPVSLTNPLAAIAEPDATIIALLPMAASTTGQAGTALHHGARTPLLALAVHPLANFAA